LVMGRSFPRDPDGSVEAGAQFEIGKNFARPTRSAGSPTERKK